jgi:ketosteroid isomerase-like protein
MTRSAEDRCALLDLVARFDDAVNRRDAKELATLWADDAGWDIGEPMPMKVQGKENIVSTWLRMIAGTRWLFRGSFAGVVTLDGDRASGRWPCIETGVFADGQGYDNRSIYEDEYVRRQGQWLFLHRRYRYLWLSSQPLPGGPIKLHENVGLTSGNEKRGLLT